MFTGIVEEVGSITKIKKQSQEAIRLTIEAHKILTDINIGDSVAVDGICLTVSSFKENKFQLDVMPETIKATSLKFAKVDTKVNLERALKAENRFGGHFVTGHIDNVGKIINQKSVYNAVYLNIQIPKTLMKYFIMKGSVAINGVSLTVFGVYKEKGIITISLIPHTVAATNFYFKKVDDFINIECDILAKHVENNLVLENLK